MRGTSKQNLTVTRPSKFATLSDADQCVLRRWIARAHSVGIDTVEDLTSRRWPAVLTAAVIGVFLFGEHSAAWLAVGQDGYWAVASCADGSVSPPVASLSDALAIVYSAREATACS
jgi:hypothetical protein